MSTGVQMVGALLIGFTPLLAFTHKLVGGTEDCGRVFITVSSLWRPAPHGRGLVDRELELNWDASGCPPQAVPDSIALFGAHPHSNTHPERPEPLVRVDTKDLPEGFYKTNVSLGLPKYPGGWNKEDADSARADGDHCFPFWVASFRNNSLLQSACFKIRPTWMGDNREVLGSATLTSLFIPGTHNSASHHQGPTLTRRDTLARYLLTQDTDVWGQLVHGVRYLDLRVAYYPFLNKTHGADHRFWINHDLIRIGPLLPVLRDIKRFLTATKREVVILDLHRFPVGFYGRQGRHRRLVTLLKQELGPYALPSSADLRSATLEQIWSQDRRLVVAYGDRQVAKESAWLWPPLTQVWGNQHEPSDLGTYLRQVMGKSPGHRANSELWAVMAELTPTPVDVMFRQSGSLRQMADSVNRNVTAWFRRLWWREANVVATDFFLGNDIVGVAVEANLRRASGER
ncbi:PI-PLC X domain-containing protein 1-like [Bacillus rossius redtenbacheri]|uniref:PI-PLC X domain-containing protein 1-like n=1 Tax=Bacillus rossius redtenbacheri TaxID=93214 RepID=UPI002FDD1DBF